jgi:hypothetical protein
LGRRRRIRAGGGADDLGSRRKISRWFGKQEKNLMVLGAGGESSALVSRSRKDQKIWIAGGGSRQEEDQGGCEAGGGSGGLWSRKRIR